MPTSNRVRQVVVTPDRGRVVRYTVDCVGNDLTAVMRWCDTHDEPVWVFGDGSSTCPQHWAVGFDDGTHVVTDGPWEHE